MNTAALWSKENHTIFSDMFNIQPGKVCLLFAGGLLETRTRATTTEFLSPQAVCVRRIVFAPDIIWGKNVTCDWVASSTSASAVIDLPVNPHDHCWQLTANNNLGIIAVPGVYRLELNDATAIGTAQVYAELIDVALLPAHMNEFFL